MWIKPGARPTPLLEECVDRGLSDGFVQPPEAAPLADAAERLALELDRQSALIREKQGKASAGGARPC